MLINLQATAFAASAAELLRLHDSMTRWLDDSMLVGYPGWLLGCWALDLIDSSIFMAVWLAGLLAHWRVAGFTACEGLSQRYPAPKEPLLDPSWLLIDRIS